MSTFRAQSSLLQVVQACLENDVTSFNAQWGSNKSLPKPTSPEPSRLVKAVYYTRRFVPTYLIVFALVIFIGYIRRRLVRSRQKQNVEEHKKSEKSISVTPPSQRDPNAQNETTTFKAGAVTERTLLLDQPRPSAAKTWFSTRAFARARAFLLYQPQPIPALTARSNNLPANSTSLLVVAFVLVNVFYLFHGIEFSKAMIFAFGGRAGALFAANIPVVYILGAKNNQPLLRLTGWSYEKLNIYHRRVGEWMMILALTHFAGMLLTFETIIKPFGYSWAWFFSIPIIILGTTALSCYLAIWVTSVGYIRNVAYEFFLASHIVLQIATLGLLFFHHSATSVPVVAALTIWILDRIVTRMCLSTKKFIATLEIAEDKTTVLLYCDILINRSKQRNIRGGWRAGQHVFLSVPGIRWYHAYQAHPFTIASPAPSPTTDGESCSLQLIIRGKDGFSKDLLEFAQFHQHAEVYLDGPYGSTDLDDAVLSADRVCLIAGGSGVSVTYPLAWSLFTRGQRTNTVSGRNMYIRGKKHVGTVSLKPLGNELENLHLWFRRTPQHSKWITIFPGYKCEAVTLVETQQHHLAIDLVSRAFDTQYGVSPARPDVATEVRSWLEGADRNACSSNGNVCLVVCGPESLVREVQNFAALLVKEGHNIDLHVEKFSW